METTEWLENQGWTKPTPKKYEPTPSEYEAWVLIQRGLQGTNQRITMPQLTEEEVKKATNYLFDLVSRLWKESNKPM